MKTKHWLWFFAIVLLLSFGSILFLSNTRAETLVAEIYQDNQRIETIDLTVLAEPKEIHVTDGEKENVILAENGQISMQSANCPDRLCVKQGAIKNHTLPIVCLPNKVTIKLVSSKPSDVDTVSR